MPVSSLKRLNIEASIAEYLADRVTLARYRDRGFETLEQAVDYLDEKINSLEAELVEQEEEST